MDFYTLDSLGFVLVASFPGMVFRSPQAFMLKSFKRIRTSTSLLPRRIFIMEDSELPSDILWDDGTPILWDDNSTIHWDSFGAFISNTNTVLPKRIFTTILE